MRNYYLNEQCRTEYLRMLMKTLIKKYHINLSSLARGIGLSPTFINDFVSMEHRVAKTITLDRIETYLDDLYDSIITDESNANFAVIEELKNRSQEYLYEVSRKKGEKNTTR